MKAILGMALGVLAIVLGSCGGGGTLADYPGSAQVDTGVIEGYITEADLERGTSDITDGIPDVEVWCEEPGSGRRLGQDTTDGRGYYCIEGVPTGEEVMLRFRYQNRSQGRDGQLDSDEVEGEQQVRLQAREQLRIDAGICEIDEDGDGIPDDVECDNEQLRVRLRTRGQNHEDG